MTIDLDEAKDRAERGLLLTARHGEALVAELKRLREMNAAMEKHGAHLQVRVDRYDEREVLVQELLEAAEDLGDELYPIQVDHDYNMRQNWLAAKAVREFKVTP